MDSAQAQLDELDRQLAQYETGQEQARLTIQELCKLDPEDYDLQKVLITFDPVELDASALVTAAVEYAQAVAAGQYEVDTAALERQVKSAVLDLSMAYESIRSARESVTQAASEVETQTQAYATGSGTKEALYSAPVRPERGSRRSVSGYRDLYQAGQPAQHPVGGLDRGDL